jgi:hypothetical protein
MRANITYLLVLGCVFFTVGQHTLGQQSEEKTTSTVEFTPEQQAARQAILTHKQWLAARAKFSQWLLVQTTYDVAEVVELEKKLKGRIAKMSSRELADFLVQMEQKLDILLSPEVSEARNMLSKYLTDSAQDQLVKKYGLENPLEMSPHQIRQALDRYQSDRSSKLAAQSAFNQSRSSQNTAVQSYRKGQQKQLDAARKQNAHLTGRNYSPTSSYAPRRRSEPQTYRAAYPKMRYSIGPWGGVWTGR